jgi:Fe-S-cluster containining protein
MCIMSSGSNSQHVQAWRAAANSEPIIAELEAVYAYIQAQVECRRPLCTQSGNCCRFEEYQHRLYVTGLEAAYTVQRLPQPITSPAIQEAKQRGGCPFQSANLCSVHTIRPLGCRIFYCDQTAQGWQEELCERMLAEVRRIHDRHAIPYRYGEWRAMLAILAAHDRSTLASRPDTR